MIYYILHTIYNVKYCGYGGWLVPDGTSVIGSKEVPVYGDRIGLISDPVSVVDVAVNDDVDEMECGCDCDTGDCDSKGFVVFVLRDCLSYFILFIIIKIKIKIYLLNTGGVVLNSENIGNSASEGILSFLFLL